MVKGSVAVAVFLMIASGAQAGFAPLTSPIPKLRGGAGYTVFAGAVRRSLIPRLRRSKGSAAARQNEREITTLMQIAEQQRQEALFRRAAQQHTSQVSIGLTALKTSLIPRLRSSALRPVVATRNNPKPIKTRIVSWRGSVCGVRDIKGVNAARINGPRGCGIARPVKITQVAGISLTRELTVNCKTARQFDSWVKRSVKPIIGRQGGGLEAVQIIGGYSCRTRNSKRGAKLSEHAKGNAVDVAGFKLRDGTIYSVKRNWRRGRGRVALHKIHKSACGPFGTVLGPNSDSHHQDHFHLDVARYRNGSYCR